MICYQSHCFYTASNRIIPTLNDCVIESQFAHLYSNQPHAKDPQRWQKVRVQHINTIFSFSYEQHASRATGSSVFCSRTSTWSQGLGVEPATFGLKEDNSATWAMPLQILLRFMIVKTFAQNVIALRKVNCGCQKEGVADLCALPSVMSSWQWPTAEPPAHNGSWSWCDHAEVLTDSARDILAFSPHSSQISNHTWR